MACPLQPQKSSLTSFKLRWWLQFRYLCVRELSELPHQKQFFPQDGMSKHKYIKKGGGSDSAQKCNFLGIHTQHGQHNDDIGLCWNQNEIDFWNTGQQNYLEVTFSLFLDDDCYWRQWVCFGELGPIDFYPKFSHWSFVCISVRQMIPHFTMVWNVNVNRCLPWRSLLRFNEGCSCKIFCSCESALLVNSTGSSGEAAKWAEPLEVKAAPNAWLLQAHNQHVAAACSRQQSPFFSDRCPPDNSFQSLLCRWKCIRKHIA